MQMDNLQDPCGKPAEDRCPGDNGIPSSAPTKLLNGEFHPDRDDGIRVPLAFPQRLIADLAHKLRPNKDLMQAVQLSAAVALIGWSLNHFLIHPIIARHTFVLFSPALGIVMGAALTQPPRFQFIIFLSLFGIYLPASSDIMRELGWIGVNSILVFAPLAIYRASNADYGVPFTIERIRNFFIIIMAFDLLFNAILNIIVHIFDLSDTKMDGIWAFVPTNRDIWNYICVNVDDVTSIFAFGIISGRVITRIRMDYPWAITFIQRFILFFAVFSFIFCIIGAQGFFIIPPIFIFVSFRYGFDGAAVAQSALTIALLLLQLLKLPSLAALGLADNSWPRACIQIGLALLIISSMYTGTALDKMRDLQRLLTENEQRARELADMKAEYLAVLSHDIRSPLGSLSLTVDLLAKAPGLTPDQRHLAKLASASGWRSTRFLNQLLSFAKSESTEPDLVLTQTNVNDIVHECISAFSPDAHAKGIELYSTICNGDEEIFVDEVRIGQILDNLVRNAISHTESGHVAVEACLRGAVLSLAVSDTGPGIPEGEMANAFNRHFVGSSKAGGTTSFGLGLYIVKSNVIAMGGVIQIDKTYTQGTRINVDIPNANHRLDMT